MNILVFILATCSVFYLFSPKIVLDSMSMSQPSDLMMEGKFSTYFNLNDHVPIETIMGIEVYTGLIGHPVEYGPRSRCGAVLL